MSRAEQSTHAAQVRTRGALTKHTLRTRVPPTQGAYVYAVAGDVTSDRRKEELLRRFMESTSHDLRTPCHGAQCAAELLAARPGVRADREALYLLAAVRASCRLMLVTVDNVLHLKALEAERRGSCAGGASSPRGTLLPPRVVRLFNLRGLFADALNVCRIGCGKEIAWAQRDDDATAAAATHAACCCGGAGCRLRVPDEVFGDVERGSRMLINLALVAVRHAGAAGAVTADLCECASADGTVCLAFAAEGRVLSPAEAAAAFDPYGGGATGLALLVARSYARAAGGDVTLVPMEDGRGMRICACLRQGAPPSPGGDAGGGGMCVGEPLTPGRPTLVATPPVMLRSPAAAPMPGDALPPEATQLTARMFDHLAVMSDVMFSIGVIDKDLGPRYVRACSSARGRAQVVCILC